MKQFSKIFLIILLLPALLAMKTNTADDAEKITINSDTFHFDNQTGVATYTGNVTATQGSRLLTGDRLEIFRDEKTGQLDTLKVYGEPAHYQGLTDPNKPLLFAEAQVITYIASTKSLTLTGSAEVKQAGDIYRAEQIEYDGIKDTVYSPPSDTGQTTIILKGHSGNKNAGI